jgi:hypothetical protein
MVLAVQACVASGAGTWFARQTVAVTDGDPEVLTTLEL